MRHEQLERINEISRRLKEMAESYERLVSEMPLDASDEMLGIVQMSGELTLDSFKRSATLLEIVRVATGRNREMQQYGLVYVEQDVYQPPRKFACISNQR